MLMSPTIFNFNTTVAKRRLGGAFSLNTLGYSLCPLFFIFNTFMLSAEAVLANQWSIATLWQMGHDL